LGAEGVECSPHRGRCPLRGNGRREKIHGRCPGKDLLETQKWRAEEGGGGLEEKADEGGKMKATCRACCPEGDEDGVTKRWGCGWGKASKGNLVGFGIGDWGRKLA